jgi:lipopolysaccharide transport system ATP-binding protein
MSEVAIKFENISKQYRLGQIGTGTLSHDLNRWWAMNIRGKEDPNLKIGQVNDRAAKATDDYVWALRNIDFEVKQGEVLGIIGKNGAGKSTLLKILSRVTTPTTGLITAYGRIASLLEVGTGFHPEMTGRENIFMNGSIMGMTKAEITRKLEEIVDFAGVEKYIDTPVKRYSSGMTVRLGFAIAAHLEPEILVVDEVLAVGDAEFQKKAIGKMQDVSKEYGRTVLFVSHNMGAINDLCNRGILLKNGMIHLEGSINLLISEHLKTNSSLVYYNEEQDNKGPKITKAIINESQLNANNIQLEIHFESPFILKTPNIGIVISDTFDIPIFGSNALIHDSWANDSINCTKGIASLNITNVPLLTGNYNVSLFLGDSKKDYSHYKNCLSFEFISSNINNINIPNKKYIGCINISNAKWTLDQN